MTTETTTRDFRDGIAIADGDEVRWESTGHLVVQLLDAGGFMPLAGCRLRVAIPKQGTVELVSDDEGIARHPDVPFQDYELALDGGLRVWVPAVGRLDEVHVRHVAARTAAYVHAVIRSPWRTALRGEAVRVTFPSGAVVEATTDDDGVLACHALDGGAGEAELATAFGGARVAVTASPQALAAVTLELP